MALLHPSDPTHLYKKQRKPKWNAAESRVVERMKEAMEVGEASGSHQGRTMRRTETEKEKTKMRERQRRAITTKIFQGLRKHGGYRLTPRADINELLRNLASEAGWVVLPDGTTYRSSTSNVLLSLSLSFIFSPAKQKLNRFVLLAF